MDVINNTSNKSEKIKIIFYNGFIHPKNKYALDRLKNIEITYVNDENELQQLDLTQYKLFMSTSKLVDISKYPTLKFLFGPHYDTFPNPGLNIIKGKNSYYNQLSDWNVNGWKQNPITNGLNLIKMPFGVDTERFNEIKPIQERGEILFYYKNRHPNDLELIKQFIQKTISPNVKVTMFGYRSNYSEIDYIKQLHNSVFGIWLGCHESQGFALQEALSCNVPLFVWSVTSIRQEYTIGETYPEIKATSTSYWDDRCGVRFTSFDEIENAFKQFIQNLYQYKPRDFILENLSMEKCEERLTEFINNDQNSD